MKKQKNYQSENVEHLDEQQERIQQTFKKEERKDIIGLILTVLFFVALIVTIVYGIYHVFLFS